MDVKVTGALLVGSVSSGVLYFILAALSLRFPARELQHKLIAAVSVLLCLHSFVNVLYPLHLLIEDEQFPAYLRALATASDWTLVLASAPGVALALLWAGLPPARAITGGTVTVLFASIALATGFGHTAFMTIGWACMLLTAYAAAKTKDAIVIRYRVLLAMSLGSVVAAESVAPGGAIQALTRFLPAFCTFLLIVRRSLFGFLISRRFLLLLLLAGISTFYMLAVKVSANSAEDAFGWFGGAFEIVMVCLGAVLWIPLYGWIFRTITRRAEYFSKFNERLIQETVRILELDQRGRFLVNQIASEYSLRRVALLSIADSRRWAAGMDAAGFPGVLQLETMVTALQTEKPGPLHVLRTADPTVRKALFSAGLTYVFPLWYDETRLTGALLVDSSPQ